MKQITNKEYEEWQKYKAEKAKGRVLLPDTVRFMCEANGYDETTMPPELRKAHQQNDKAVMQAYGFWGKLNTESECVAELMRMYQRLTQP